MGVNSLAGHFFEITDVVFFFDKEARATANDATNNTNYRILTHAHTTKHN